MTESRSIAFFVHLAPPCRLMLIFPVAAALVFATGFLEAATAEPRRMHTIDFTVTDEHGRPVSSARIAPFALVTKTAAHHGNEPDWRSIPVARSDSDGKASLQIPATVGEQTVQTVHWSVQHENHVPGILKSAATQQAVSCQLRRGRRIAVSAIDHQTGHRLRANTFAVLNGHGAFDRWNQMSSGIVVSDGVAIRRHTLRLIHLQPNQPARFSAAIDLSEYGEQLRVFLHDVVVRPGTRVVGRVDDQVPRPVHGGIVTAFVVHGRNEWHDMADVNEDGTFVIESLPRDEVLQLTAWCPNWVSSDPTLAELEAANMKDKASRLQRSRVYPQLVRLDGDEVHPEIRMEPTATCRVTVSESGGTPIQGARVRLIPYQGSFDGRSNIFGHGESTARRLLAAETGVSLQRCIELGIVRDAKSRFVTFTGDDGVAEVTSLPGGPDDSPAMTSFVVTHPDYFAVNSGGLGDQGSSRAALYSGQTADVSVRMKRK